MGLLDEQGMHAILQERLQKRDSAYEVSIAIYSPITDMKLQWEGY